MSAQPSRKAPLLAPLPYAHLLSRAPPPGSKPTRAAREKELRTLLSCGPLAPVRRAAIESELRQLSRNNHAAAGKPLPRRPEPKQKAKQKSIRADRRESPSPSFAHLSTPASYSDPADRRLPNMVENPSATAHAIVLAAAKSRTGAGINPTAPPAGSLAAKILAAGAKARTPTG